MLTAVPNRFLHSTENSGEPEIVSDSQISFALAKAAAGAVVVLTVTGRNSAGESPASAPVEFTVP